jgi:uncharacterized membrane protein
MKKVSPRLLVPGISLLAIVPILMSLARPFLADTGAYIWMNWNLFLGLVPLVFAWWYQQYANKNTLLKYLLFFAWLFFLPNAPYMITDFIHIADVGPKSLLWYDALMLSGYAFVGMLSWVISTKMVYGKMKARSFIPIVSFLTAFGIYLGRYIRFNTWDILTQPLDIIQYIGDVMIHPLEHNPVLLFVAVFWVFLMTNYLGYAYVFRTLTSFSR